MHVPSPGPGLGTFSAISAFHCRFGTGGIVDIVSWARRQLYMSTDPRMIGRQHFSVQLSHFSSSSSHGSRKMIAIRCSSLRVEATASPEPRV